MIEQILVGQFLAVTHGANMFHLNAPSFLDDFICLGLKFDHWREVCMNRVGCPDLRMDDPVQRPARLLDGEQASDAVFAI